MKFLSLLPEFYGDELDRQKIWDRISNGILVSVAKCNKSWDKFVNDMLVYIKADPVRTASNQHFLEFMESMIEKEHYYHIAWLRCFETRHMILIPFARQAWTLQKEVLKEDAKVRKSAKKEIPQKESTVRTPASSSNDSLLEGGLF